MINSSFAQLEMFNKYCSPDFLFVMVRYRDPPLCYEVFDIWGKDATDDNHLKRLGSNTNSTPCNFLSKSQLIESIKRDIDGHSEVALLFFYKPTYVSMSSMADKINTLRGRVEHVAFSTILRYDESCYKQY